MNAFELGWPQSPSEYASVYFIKDLGPEIKVDDIGVVVDSIVNDNGEIGYVIEVGPWDSNGAPRLVVTASKEVFALE